MEESALVLRRTPCCGGERSGVEETALVLSRAPWCSVRKAVSRSKFTEQIFTPQTEQNYQMCVQIISLL